MNVETVLLEVDHPKEKRQEVKWEDCKICGMGHAGTPESKGLCHDCRRLKAYIRPVIDQLTVIATLLKEQK